MLTLQLDAPVTEELDHPSGSMRTDLRAPRSWGWLLVPLLLAGLSVEARADHRVGDWNARTFEDTTPKCVAVKPLEGTGTFVEIRNGCDAAIALVPEDCSPYDCRAPRPIPVGFERRLAPDDVGIDPHELSSGDTIRGTLVVRRKDSGKRGAVKFEAVWTFEDYTGCGCALARRVE